MWTDKISTNVYELFDNQGIDMIDQIIGKANL